MCLIKKKKLYLSPNDLATKINTPANLFATPIICKQTTKIVKAIPVSTESLFENTRNIIRHTSSVINGVKPNQKDFNDTK